MATKIVDHANLGLIDYSYIGQVEYEATGHWQWITIHDGMGGDVAVEWRDLDALIEVLQLVRHRLPGTVPS